MTCFPPQAVQAAAEGFPVHGELQPEGGGLGVDAVAAAHHDGALVLHGAGLHGLHEVHQRLAQHLAQVAHRQAVAKLDRFRRAHTAQPRPAQRDQRIGIPGGAGAQEPALAIAISGVP